MNRWIAATDGSCLGNPGEAGWAWALTKDPADLTVQDSAAGALGIATNNVAELTALLELLKAVPAEQPLEIRMDSQYAMNAASKWIHGWRKRGWRKADGKAISNKEIIMAIDEQLTGRDVEFVWVKAHLANGDPLNAFVDEAAREAATAGL